MLVLTVDYDILVKVLMRFSSGRLSSPKQRKQVLSSANTSASAARSCGLVSLDDLCQSFVCTNHSLAPLSLWYQQIIYSSNLMVLIAS
jgi:hypothetical protein